MHIHVNLWICNFKPKERGVSDNENTFSYQIQDSSYYKQNVSSIPGVSDKTKNVRVYQSLTLMIT